MGNNDPLTKTDKARDVVFQMKYLYIIAELVERPWFNQTRRADCPAIFCLGME